MGSLQSIRPSVPVLVCLVIAVMISAFPASPSFGADPSDTVAIRGYDTVAYFREGRAVRGDRAFSFRWRGYTWLFTSQEYRDLFAASPVMYAPQYDGYCAWAMTEGRKSLTDPEIWKIVNCRLYLNCSRSSFDRWSRDIPGNIKKADAHWARLAGGK